VLVKAPECSAHTHNIATTFNISASPSLSLLLMESMQNDRCQLHVTGTGANRVTITIIIIYGGVVMAQSYCKSSSGSFDECRLSTGWPPALRPSQSTWAVSPPKIG